MAEHIEARSLASLNFLAANPPQYPTNPAEKKQEPITLYISRVPGTRDVILSTFKPQIKNVTAEDIANSLYYVHLNTPEDELLMPSSSPRSSSESPRVQIQRKPVPVPAYSTSPTAPANFRDSKVIVDPASHLIHPALREDDRNSPIQPQPPTNPQFEPPSILTRPPTDPPTGPIPRKPLGLRTTSLEHHKVLPSLPPPYDEAPALPPRPNGRAPSPHSPVHPSPLAPPVPEHRSRSPSPTYKRPFQPFSLTLIRRDPSSGQQWNIGKVASFQLEHPEQLLDDKTSQSSPSIMIHLETSGYAKFRGMPTQPSFGSADYRPSLDMRPQSSGANSVSRPGEELQQQGIFERQVKMSYSHSWTANLRQALGHRSSRADQDDLPVSPVGGHARRGHARQGSQASVGSFGGDFDGSDAPVITQPAPGLKPRGYVFTSPWDGRCEFVTGNGGRSLRCRHILPNFSGNVFNPLVHDGASGDEGPSRNRQATAVSELRFNLPTSEIFRDRKALEGGARARDQIQGQFSRILNLSSNSTDTSDDEPPPLDLTLGREKAGGGNRGKRAKMGKLIIAEDGLKMIDLVVAANMGVWWVSWERTY